MINIQNLLENKKHLKISTVIFAFVLVMFFSPISNNINHTIQSFFKKTAGNSIPDTNIVLIHITKNDIEKLGTWPLKRSYYALLLNNLNRYGIKGIGFEIFLSDNLSFQTVYNQLLSEQISQTKNVLLSSQISDLYFDGDQTTADSIIYPQPKSANKNIVTGHLNYKDKLGIYIPTKLNIGDKNEYAFSYAAAKIIDSSLTADKIIKVNFNLSWKDFSNYSLLEFFKLAEEKDKRLNDLKDKFILLGVSDPSTAKFISTPNNERLPGIGLHAIAIDNLLNNNYLNSSFIFLSSFVFFFLFLFVSYKDFAAKDITCCILLLAACIILSFLIFVYFSIELNYSAFLLPFAFLVLIELLIQYWESKTELSTAINEKELLKISLLKKENSLLKLQEEIERAANNPDDNLTKKIDSLKNEISELKNSQQEDLTPAAGLPEPKNFNGIIYISKAVENVADTIKKIAPTNATALLLGESGSGKELAARAIHTLSNRSENKFLAINCAALTDSLLESELFGHKKGSFTNAGADKQGMFEAADKGTIFLDEIGETSENFQVKLLRVLQSGEIQKVGDTSSIFVDVRIIAATNKNLEELVKQKKFREDLYYRLNVIQVKLPNLRERKEDIKILANHFAKKEDAELTISKAVVKQLEQNDWKGNVRELESIIKRAAIFANSENRKIIMLNDLPPELVKFDKTNLESLILESLREKKFSHSSINETAKELGNLSRTIISENFRGIFFKFYCENNFNLDLTVNQIANSDEGEIIEKVNSKTSTYLNNIQKDIRKHSTSNFEELKKIFQSKYKNLPQRYHQYLDEIIQQQLRS
ncbi:MAG: sigma 54-interacting transcriptional regulator [Ignavibacteriae bacterium]|jgi:DNA-binding NtrC family response regulator/CHASE2 domain-containing sensor protein|nr:sigma 54-interacting transcriptional regulator [Ignavibacteriota bacterium]